MGELKKLEEVRRCWQFLRRGLGPRWVHAFCVIAGQWDYWILPHRLRLFVAFWGSWICCQSTVTFWRGPSFWLENEKDHKPSKPFQSNDDVFNWSRPFPTTSLRVEHNFPYFQVTRLYFRGCGLRCVILVDRMIVAQMLGGGSWSLCETKGLFVPKILKAWWNECQVKPEVIYYHRYYIHIYI